jgi:hypothetical protein
MKCMNVTMPMVVIGALLVASCASAQGRPQALMSFAGAGEPNAIEIVAPPISLTGHIAWLRAQEVAEDKLRIISSFRATLFEDVDGNEQFNDGDRRLDYCYGTTELPSSFIEVSGLQVPPGVQVGRVRVLAEVRTTLGTQTKVLGSSAEGSTPHVRGD